MTVVAQIALALATLLTAVELVLGTIGEGVLGPGFAAEEYLTARLEWDREMVAAAYPGIAGGKLVRFALRRLSSRSDPVPSVRARSHRSDRGSGRAR